MRTEKEIRTAMRLYPKDSEATKALSWVLQTCSNCNGEGKMGECPKCGRYVMCCCDGTSHKLGLGCL